VGGAQRQDQLFPLVEVRVDRLVQLGEDGCAHRQRVQLRVLGL
jgi:hypothetical protein